MYLRVDLRALNNMTCFFTTGKDVPDETTVISDLQRRQDDQLSLSSVSEDLITNPDTIMCSLCKPMPSKGDEETSLEKVSSPEETVEFPTKPLSGLSLEGINFKSQEAKMPQNSVTDSDSDHRSLDSGHRLRSTSESNFRPKEIQLFCVYG